MARPRQATDEALLKATAAAVGQVGLARLTLADVADLAGVSPATLVQRFGSKRALLAAFTAWAAEGVEVEFAAARSAAGNALDGLRRALQGMTRHVSTPETFSHHLALLQLDLTDPTLRVPATQHTRAVRGALRRLLDEAVETGDLRPTDTEALAAAVHSVYTGAVLNWGLDPRGPLAERLDADLAVLLDPYRVEDVPKSR